MGIIGDLFELGSSSVRSLARNLFPGFYERNLSANDALLELRSQGLGYRRQDFLNDFRTDKSSFDQATAIRNVNLLSTPTESILKPQYFGVKDKYSLKFTYHATDQLTGESFDSFIFYHRNTLDTRASMENQAMDFLRSESDKYPFDISSVRIAEGYINPVWE